MRGWVGALGAAVLAVCAVCAGCTSINSFLPERVEARRQAIERRFGVQIDLKRTSPLRGDTWRTLARIEADLEPFPPAYTGRIAAIHVVEEFISRYGLVGASAAAYCEDEHPALYRHVFIKNKNVLEDAIGLLMMDIGIHLAHEGWHSVEYWEIMRHRPMLRRVLPNPKTLFSDLEVVDAAAVAESLRLPHGPAARGAYVRLLRDWMFAHFGDVNGDGRVDQADADAVAADPERFDADHDGALIHADVRRLTPYRYLHSTSPIDPVLQLAMALEQFTGWAPRGFASVYGADQPWEDRAEVMALMHRRGYLTLLREAGRQRDRAARRLERLRRRDPVLARKVDLMLRYLQACKADGSTPD